MQQNILNLKSQFYAWRKLYWKSKKLALQNHLILIAHRRQFLDKN